MRQRGEGPAGARGHPCLGFRGETAENSGCRGAGQRLAAVVPPSLPAWAKAPVGPPPSAVCEVLSGSPCLQPPCSCRLCSCLALAPLPGHGARAVSPPRAFPGGLWRRAWKVSTQRGSLPPSPRPAWQGQPRPGALGAPQTDAHGSPLRTAPVLGQRGQALPLPPPLFCEATGRVMTWRVGPGEGSTQHFSSQPRCAAWSLALRVQARPPGPQRVSERGGP